MNPLTDLIPAKLRKYLYAAVFLGGFVFTAWQAADGDWKTFVAALVPTLTSLLAASNTDVEAPVDREEDQVDGHAAPDEVAFPG